MNSNHEGVKGKIECRHQMHMLSSRRTSHVESFEIKGMTIPNK